VNRFKLSIAIAASLLATLGTPQAMGDVIPFGLTNHDIGEINCCSGPHALVPADHTYTTTNTLMFDSLTRGGFFHLLDDTSERDRDNHSHGWASDFDRFDYCSETCWVSDRPLDLPRNNSTMPEPATFPWLTSLGLLMGLWLVFRKQAVSRS
jgi:hypothetical protein